jgi:hypothetical protein
MRLLPSTALLALALPVLAEEPVRLIEKAARGSEFHVITNSTISGELQTPAAKDKPAGRLRIEGRSSIDYAEKILPADPKVADFKSLRVYERIDFRKSAGDRTDEMTLRPAVRRLVLMKKGPAKVPFSPDGPLLWTEIEMLRTDNVVPALAGLLPDKDVRTDDTWKATMPAVIELTAFEKVEQGELVCKLERVQTLGKRRLAHVSLAGSLQGVNEDGPVRQKLTGRLTVDLTAEIITFLRVDGEHILLDGMGKEAGKVTGTFELQRQQVHGHPAISDAALKGLDLNPSEENTRLLYTSDETGVRFVHSRNWRVVRTTGRQITLDETNGAGLLITLDTPDAVPSAGGYLREAIKDLEARGARLLGRTAPQRLADGVDRFTLDAEFGKDKVTMDYLVIRRDKGAATLASRLPEAHREARMKELEWLARSFVVTRRLDGK